MILFIDTNILLDVLTGRDPYCMDSSKIWKMCETGICKGYVSALSVANIVYIMRRELNPERIEQVLLMLNQIFETTDLQTSDIMRAAEMKWKDFEDAVQASTALRIQADYIITRNTADFLCSNIPVIAPSDLPV